MNALFEYTDKLNAPYECFVFDTSKENFPVQPHWHYFMELIYMIDGTALMNCDEQSFVAEQGDMVLFLPHRIHSIYAVTNMPMKYYVLKFDVGQFAAAVKGGSGDIPFPALFRAARGKETARLLFRAEELEGFPAEQIFERGCKEIQRQEFGCQMMMKAYISMLLTFVVRRWREEGFDTDQAYTESTEEDHIYYITEYIDGHIQEVLKVEELARLCNMSYSYFAKVFRELYGQSCKKYIEFIRLCKAEELLNFTSQDLSYISQETGFSDCSHFIRAFKKKHGMTPGKYRERNKR